MKLASTRIATLIYNTDPGDRGVADDGDDAHHKQAKEITNKNIEEVNPMMYYFIHE